MTLRVIVGFLLLLGTGSSVSAAGPVPPCGGPPVPAPGGAGAPPVIQVWPQGGLGATWTPPACSGWNAPGFRSLIALAGRFQLLGGMDALLDRFGAVSKRAGIRYWSVTEKRWRTLIREAHAVQSASGPPRADFTAAEFTPGQDLAFSQTDTGSGTVSYRLRVLSRTPTRVVLATENTSTVRYAVLPLFHPGDLQSLYVLEQQPGDIWLYYDLTRIGFGASSLTDGHDASGVNRAVAWFRHIAGIPTDREPPASP